MIKTLHNKYCNSKQGYLPLLLSDCLNLFLSDCLNLLDPVLTFDRLMGGIDLNNYSKQRQLLREWLLEVESSGIKEFKAAITAFRNNYSYILNALKYRHI